MSVKKSTGPTAARSRRWSLNFAAMEFSWDRGMLEKARRKLGIEAGEDGFFSTKQICAMIFGDKQLADTKRAEAEAETAIRRNQREAGELIPVSMAVALSAKIDVLIRQQICAASMPDSEKDAILATIESAKELDWAKAAREAMK